MAEPSSPGAYEAVAVVETSSIAKGYVALDALVKKARVHVKWARPVSPGKLVLIFGGDVESTTQSFEAAKEAVGSTVLDELLLPYAHAALLPAVDAAIVPAAGDAVGIVETTTVASALLCADVALKAVAVSVLKLHLAVGIGGKGYFTLAGALSDVEAALALVKERAAPERLVAVELIPQPHREVRGHLG